MKIEEPVKMNIPEKLSEAEAIRQEVIRTADQIYKLSDYPSQVRPLIMKIKRLMK